MALILNVESVVMTDALMPYSILIIEIMVSEAGIEPASLPSKRSTLPLRHSEMYMYLMEDTLKTKILLLRSKGLTYKQISKEIGCAKSTVSYHCNESVKKEVRDKNKQMRNRGMKDLKLRHGGMCQACGYSICLEALHFHHPDPSQKEGLVSHIIVQKGINAAAREAAKCLLLCGNCHCEVHAGKRDIAHLKPLECFKSNEESGSPGGIRTHILPLSEADPIISQGA